MAGASFYAPIRQAMSDLNKQMNINAARTMQMEHQVAQQELANAKLNAELTDPRRVLAMEQAAAQLAPTTLNLSAHMPGNGNSNTSFGNEMWQAFKPQVAGILGDPDVTISPNGEVLDGHGAPVMFPKWKQQKMMNRINAAQMLTFDEERLREGKIRTLQNQIEDKTAEFKRTKNPALQMELKGMLSNLEQQKAEYSNNGRRLMSLRRKSEMIDRHIYQSRLDGVTDPGWFDVLKSMGARTQDEINATLRAMGKGADGAKGIVLKRYFNPQTKQVIEVPVHKSEGAQFQLRNPWAGGEQHLGTFVLKDDRNIGKMSTAEAADKARSFMGEVRKISRNISYVEGLKSGAMTPEQAAELGIDPEILAMLSAPNWQEALDTQLQELRTMKKFYEEDLKGFYDNPKLKGILDSYFGTKKKPGYKDDSLGLLNTPSGSVYKDAPDSLFKK